MLQEGKVSLPQLARTEIIELIFHPLKIVESSYLQTKAAAGLEMQCLLTLQTDHVDDAMQDLSRKLEFLLLEKYITAQEPEKCELYS